MDSKTGLIIQFIGIFLIAVLSFFLHRSLKSRASGFWFAGWMSLSFALFCISATFVYPQFFRVLCSFYFLFEYLFGFFLILGCRSLYDGFRLSGRHIVYFLPFACAAFILPYVAQELNTAFTIHSILIASLFAAAFRALSDSHIKSFGWRVMRTFLFLLTLDFLHYFAVLILLRYGINFFSSQSYLAFSPIIDLVLEIQLGFGMVIVLLEQVLQETKTVNTQLYEAHKKLEETAQTDSLTTAFNRHAFYGFLKNSDGNELITGCVGFFDIDDLKPINDRFGHYVGDMAIRAVVGAIRKLMRAEDLIYRWGGDEFFVIMVGMNAEMARERMSELEHLLSEVYVENSLHPISVGVSFGFQDFSDISNLEQSVKLADEEMYRKKQERKQSKISKSNRVYYPDPNESQTRNYDY